MTYSPMAYSPMTCSPMSPNVEPHRWMTCSLGPDLAVIDIARNVFAGAYEFETEPGAFL